MAHIIRYYARHETDQNYVTGCPTLARRREWPSIIRLIFK